MTPHRRRILLVAMLAVAAVVLMLAPDALAAAGGGSAGFSGGGEGGGGGGGGGGAGLFILFQLLFRIALLGHGIGALVLIGLFVIWFVLTRGRGTGERVPGGPR